MALTQLYLSPELEDLITQIQAPFREKRSRTAHLPKSTKPGRPRTKFRLSEEQASELRWLQIQHGRWEHPMVQERLKEFEALWEAEKARETELRVVTKVMKACPIEPTVRLTKQAIILEALAEGLKLLVVKYNEAAKELSEKTGDAQEEARKLLEQMAAKKIAEQEATPKPRRKTYVFGEPAIKATPSKQRSR